MKQSRATSFVKSCVSTAVGFAIAYVANMLILPLFGLPLSHSANLLLTTIYTVISIARGYLLERAFEAMGWRTRMSAFALAALAERARQVTHEGYDQHHDDAHGDRELASAAAAYLLNSAAFWPWHDGFKPEHGLRRSYVKAAALALAAGEHVDRNRRRPHGAADATPQKQERAA